MITWNLEAGYHQGSSGKRKAEFGFGFHWKGKNIPFYLPSLWAETVGISLCETGQRTHKSCKTKRSILYNVRQRQYRLEFQQRGTDKKQRQNYHSNNEGYGMEKTQIERSIGTVTEGRMVRFHNRHHSRTATCATEEIKEYSPGVAKGSNGRHSNQFSSGAHFSFYSREKSKL